MGARQSVEESESENEEENEQEGQVEEVSDEEENDEDDMGDEDDEGLLNIDGDLQLEQEPELSPFNHSQTPLQPQEADSFQNYDSLRPDDPEMLLADAADHSSALNILPQVPRYTRQGGGSISTPGSPLGGLSRSGSGSDFGMSHFLPLLPSSVPPSARNRICAREVITEIYLIRHGESSHNLTTLIGGRSPLATLTPKGRRQAAVLGRFLREFLGFQFDAYYTSPLERARATAVTVCKELGVPEGKLMVVDALQELSQGEWEGKPRGEVYTPAMVSRMTASQPDFRAPGGESQRQVEFRMMDVLMSIVSQAEDLDAHVANTHPVDVKGTASPRTRYGRETDLRAPVSPAGAYYQQQRGGESFVSKNGSTVYGSGEGERERDSNGNFSRGTSTVFRAVLFSHATAIKCLLRGVLGSSPQMTHKISIDNTSITVLRHTSSTGWNLLRANDISHLRLARGPLNTSKREEV